MCQPAWSRQGGHKGLDGAVIEFDLGDRVLGGGGGVLDNGLAPALVHRLVELII